MTLRIRSNLGAMALNAPDPMELNRARGAIGDQMVNRYQQMPEVTNAQPQYEHQAALAQQMAGGPGSEPLNAVDMEGKGLLNGAAMKADTVGPNAVQFMNSAILPLQPGGEELQRQGMQAAQRIAQRGGG